eukprot:GHRQ01037705.1.p1 GENE.GHRQ01037705.1~~GHRQ01037705.1.p1  ORF type:complete len:108 (+),score=3.91 GHRQ01037705.1:223-546(+)
MQQHARDAIACQVNGQALVHDVQRGLAGSVRVPAACLVVIHRAHFAADVCHEGFAAKAADEAVDQQLLHHEQRPDRVGPEGLQHVLLGHCLDVHCGAIDACVVNDDV